MKCKSFPLPAYDEIQSFKLKIPKSRCFFQNIKILLFRGADHLQELPASNPGLRNSISYNFPLRILNGFVNEMWVLSSARFDEIQSFKLKIQKIKMLFSTQKIMIYFSFLGMIILFPKVSLWEWLNWFSLLAYDAIMKFNHSGWKSKKSWWFLSTNQDSAF